MSQRHPLPSALALCFLLGGIHMVGPIVEILEIKRL
jgi:hypothetical protein